MLFNTLKYCEGATARLTRSVLPARSVSLLVTIRGPSDAIASSSFKNLKLDFFFLLTDLSVRVFCYIQEVSILFLVCNFWAIEKEV